MNAEKFPVVEKWGQILEWIVDRAGHYPKSTRFTIAGRTINHALDIQEKLIEAIYTKNRLHILVQINIYTEKLRFLIRLAFRNHYISIQQFEFISAEINAFGKMIGGWIKSSR